MTDLELGPAWAWFTIPGIKNSPSDSAKKYRMLLNLNFRGQSGNLLQENCLLEAEWLLEVGLGDVEKKS